MVRWKLALTVVAVLLVTWPAAAQTMTPQEKKNLDLVLDWWRVLQSGHGELVPQYIAPDVKQHNPNVGQGAAAIAALLASRPKVEPMPQKLTPAQTPLMTLSQGDIVVLIWDREAKEPGDPSKTYHYNAFDAFRVKDGKITEHWDAALKAAPQR